MLKQVLLFSLMAVFSFSAGISQVNAQAIDMSEALKRMDAIIAEMRALRSEFASIASSIGQAETVSTPAVLDTVSTNVFSQSLAYGEDNEDIKTIQKLLATDKDIYPYGVVSGFYGPKTREAIRNFQARFGLDAVGVIGPATKALLNLFIVAYPDGNYPENVLKNKPKSTTASAGASRSKPVVASTPKTTNVLKYLKVDEDDDEYVIRVSFTTSRKDTTIVIYADDTDELVEKIATKLKVSKSDVSEILKVKTKKDSDTSSDQSDAEDALDDASRAIKEARKEMRNAEEDGDDIDDAQRLYSDARELHRDARGAFKEEEYDNVVTFAKKAQKRAEEALDELGVKSKKADDIDTIEAKVRENNTRVYVTYDNDDEEKLVFEESKRDKIIETIADKLDVSENDVSDVIEFVYGPIDRIDATISDDSARVRVYYDSGVKEKLVVNSDNEKSIIKKIAKELDINRGDVEDAIEFN